MEEMVPRARAVQETEEGKQVTLYMVMRCDHLWGDELTHQTQIGQRIQASRDEHRMTQADVTARVAPRQAGDWRVGGIAAGTSATT